jgi:hypothetical protein
MFFFQQDLQGGECFMFSVDKKLELRCDCLKAVNTEKVTLRRSIPEDSDQYIRLNLDNYRKMMSGLPTLLKSAKEGKSEYQTNLVTLCHSLIEEFKFEEAIQADVTPSTIHLFHFGWRSVIGQGNDETFEDVLSYLPLSVSELEKLISAQEKFEQLYKAIKL